MANGRPKRSAIFGGSFDPVHLGHLGMMREAIEAMELDEIVVTPCFVSPFKSGTIATGPQRAEMMRMALRDEGLEIAQISTFEIDRNQPSYSWETATHFNSAFPETEWYWILGTDQWNAFDRWAEPEKLRELLRFIILTRNEDPVMERSDWNYEKVLYSHPASSSAIRENFESHTSWMTPSVIAFCREEGLYEAEF
ncbi:MAG: nicotinate (nicotinamide) nucleotide adenylyltransferase [Verrucomicrobiales bacterium]|nr:nicotinate (nicotinamide) nucleotide adenylyltransferase [Verrucomicrobiales bacterium]